MLPPALAALAAAGWRFERDLRSVLLGLSAGLLGAGGQLLLFKLTPGLAPTYLAFPFIALNPVVTILLAAAVGGERTPRMGWCGIALAVVAGVLLNAQPATTTTRIYPLWIGYAGAILSAWGAQGYVISRANRSMSAESIFIYMTATGIALAPIAVLMTTHSHPINWGWSGVGMSTGIQLLNSVGALLLVYAYRYGKALIVAPLTNAGAPVITALISLAVNKIWPTQVATLGILLAVTATVLMAVGEGSSPGPRQESPDE
jgi:drug/metabolite transporter (DMT)-like permease